MELQKAWNCSELKSGTVETEGQRWDGRGGGRDRGLQYVGGVGRQAVPLCATATISLSCWATRRRASSAIVLQQAQSSAMRPGGKPGGQHGARSPGDPDARLLSDAPAALSSVLSKYANASSHPPRLELLDQGLGRRIGGHLLRRHSARGSTIPSPSFTAVSAS